MHALIKERKKNAHAPVPWIVQTCMHASIKKRKKNLRAPLSLLACSHSSLRLAPHVTASNGPYLTKCYWAK